VIDLWKTPGCVNSFTDTNILDWPIRTSYQQQMQQDRLQKRGPGGAGGDENIVPETCRERGDRDLRGRLRQEQVKQIAEEHAMARFQSTSSRRRGAGLKRSTLWFAIKPQGLVHGHTRESERN